MSKSNDYFISHQLAMEADFFWREFREYNHKSDPKTSDSDSVSKEGENNEKNEKYKEYEETPAPKKR